MEDGSNITREIYLHANGRPLRVGLRYINQFPPWYHRYNGRGDATFVPQNGDGASGWRSYGAWGDLNYASDNKGYYNWNGAWGYMSFPPKFNFDMNDALDMGLYYAHGRWYNQDTGLWLSPNEKGDYLYGGDGQDPVNVGWVDFDCSGLPWFLQWLQGSPLCDPTPTPQSPQPPSPTPATPPTSSTTPSRTATLFQVLRATVTSIATSTPNPLEADILARMLYREERSEPKVIQASAAWVVRNRVTQGYRSRTTYRENIESGEFKYITPEQAANLNGTNLDVFNLLLGLAGGVITGAEPNPMTIPDAIFFSNTAFGSQSSEYEARLNDPTGCVGPGNWGVMDGVLGRFYYYRNNASTTSPCHVLVPATPTPPTR